MQRLPVQNRSDLSENVSCEGGWEHTSPGGDDRARVLGTPGGGVRCRNQRVSGGSGVVGAKCDEDEGWRTRESEWAQERWAPRDPLVRRHDFVAMLVPRGAAAYSITESHPQKTACHGPAKFPLGGSC